MNDLTQVAEAIATDEPPDLSIAGVRKQLAAQILADIDDYCAEAYDDGHRKHLGASLIGHVCSRYLWLVFRWAKHVKHSGRMQRLFNRGHREEERFTEWLRGIGCEVWDKDENGNQFRVKGCLGHFGGSLDAIYKLPAKYRVPFAMLGEDKTSGTGAGFEKLKSKGVAIAKPQHYSQMSIYGKNYGFRYALYMCINKNDDGLYTEIVALDWSLAETMERKADDIIRAQTPPEKFALSEAVFECKYCDFVAICHRGESVEKNCRSCSQAVAIDGGLWHCEHFNGTIPEDFVKQACDNWKSIV